MVTPVFKDMLPAGASNRPGTKLPFAGPLFVVIHETGNENVGADAASQIAYLRTQDARNRQVSYHFSVDDHAIVQGLPLDEIGWHAGDGCDETTDIGCFRSIAIEGCVNADGNEAQMRRNFAELIARICKGDPVFDWGSGFTRGRFGIDRLKLHIEVSTPGPNQHHCPDHMLREGFVPKFKQMVAEAFGAPAKTKETFPANRVFHATDGALERRGPNREAAVVKSLAEGETITCKGFVLGQVIDHDDRWLQTIDSPILYVHSSGVVEAI